MICESIECYHPDMRASQFFFPRQLLLMTSHSPRGDSRSGADCNPRHQKILFVPKWGFQKRSIAGVSATANQSKHGPLVQLAGCFASVWQSKQREGAWACFVSRNKHRDQPHVSKNKRNTPPPRGSLVAATVHSPAKKIGGKPKPNNKQQWRAASF